jgi:hypothetical protein
MCFKETRLIVFTGFGAWPVEGRRKGQFTCFLDEVVDGMGLRTKQGEEACCYDVSFLPSSFLVMFGWLVGW